MKKLSAFLAKALKSQNQPKSGMIKNVVVAGLVISLLSVSGSSGQAREEAETLSKQVSVLSEKNQELKENQTELENEIDTLSSEKEQYENELSEKKTELESFENNQKKYEKLQQDYSSLEKDNKKLKKQNEKLTAQVTEAEKVQKSVANQPSETKSDSAVAKEGQKTETKPEPAV